MVKITKAETALLGLLTESPMYPYQIEKEVEFREMRLWTELSMSSIYKTLKKLEEKGLVDRKNKVSEENRIRKLYSISEKGTDTLKNELLEMITEPEHIVWQVDLATYNLDVLPRKEAMGALQKYRTKLEEKIEFWKGVQKCLTELECPDYRFAISTRPQFLLKGEIEWVDSYIKELEA
jgi:DNA-binding PadR family transcriptional regulator